MSSRDSRRGFQCLGRSRRCARSALLEVGDAAARRLRARCSASSPSSTARPAPPRPSLRRRGLEPRPPAHQPRHRGPDRAAPGCRARGPRRRRQLRAARRRLLPARSRDGRSQLLHARRRLVRAPRWPGPGKRRPRSPARPPWRWPATTSAAACELARRARSLAPQMALPYAPLADAQIELGPLRGRRPHAEPDGSPEGEPHGLRADLLLPRAPRRPPRRARRRCASRSRRAPEAPEGEAYVQGLLGKLLADLGRYGAAEHAYRQALAINPGYPPALAGIAGVEAGRGDFDPAIRRLPRGGRAPAAPRVRDRAGRDRAGRGQARPRRSATTRWSGAEVKLLRANGVNTDVDLALFEANHGSSRRAVSFGRRAWSAGAERPLGRRLLLGPVHGGPDRAGDAVLRGGDEARLPRPVVPLPRRDDRPARRATTIEARRLLGALVAQSPRFSPLYAPRARRALEGLR